jgi:hypothetical protein
MYKPKIFIIAGESNSGKTTCAMLLKNYHEIITSNCNVMLLAFADALKEFSAELMNNFYNPEIPFDPISMNNNEYKESIRPYEYKGQPMTVRKVLIDIGMRVREINPDIWVDAIIAKIKQNTIADRQCIFIIHDNRFCNETKKIMSTFANDYTIVPIRLYRDSAVTQHNENEIDQFAKEYNYKLIANNGTCDDLYHALIKIDQ